MCVRVSMYKNCMHLVYCRSLELKILLLQYDNSILNVSPSFLNERHFTILLYILIF